MATVNRIWFACLMGLLGGGGAMAADAPSTPAVLGKVHRSNLHEIEMGKMAENRGMSKEVQDFGKMLVKDHATADKKVVKLAKDEKVDLAANTPPADTHIDHKHTGTAFDDAFATDMLADHEKAVAELMAARDATTDQKLKQLLTNLLPVLKKHQDTAQKLVDGRAKHST